MRNPNPVLARAGVRVTLTNENTNEEGSFAPGGADFVPAHNVFDQEAWGRHTQHS